MKTSIKTLSALLLATTFLATSCIKKPEATPEEETPATTTGGSTNNTNTTPGTTIPGSDGTYVGLKNLVITNYTVAGIPISTTVYSEIASSSVYNGSSALVDAGTIKCNDSVLTKQSSNSYMFNKQNSNSTSNFTNYFNSGTAWNISGNSGNAVPSFTYTLSTFPITPALNLGSTTPTISKSSAYTVNFGNVSGADSIICQIVGGGGTILTSKSIAASSYSSHGFTGAEMGTLQASSVAGGVPTGQVSVFAYKYGSTTIGSPSKKYWFVNISTKTYLANIQ